MATKDGNVQDMAVEDKEHPSLAATEEAQDVSTLNPIIVPMPSFTDPNNPAASGGSINLDLDEHPVVHSDDYGAAYGERDVAPSIADTHSRDMGAAAVEPGDPGRREKAARKAGGVTEFPENRGDWSKKHWQARAQELELPTSGNTDTVKARVEEEEGYQEEVKGWNAGAWQDALDQVETQEDLDELKYRYDKSGADFSTVASAFEAKQTELNEQ